MKRKILVPMFASVMALSMNSVANADEVENKNIENKEENKSTILDLGEYEDATYKIAAIKDGVAVKIREQGSVQHVAYTGDEFKVVGTQGEWAKVVVGDGEGWIPLRFVDIKEAYGYTTANKVNFRKEASVDSEIVEELEIGSTVKVLENNGSWIKVKKGENEGYISSLYVSDEAPAIEVEKEVVQNTESRQASNNDRTSNNTSNSNNNRTSNNTSNSNNNGGQVEKPSQKPPQNNNGSYNPPASNASVAQAVVNLAYSKLGCPYVWGAEGPNSFDCSGLTSYVYRNAAGITIPRSSSAQAGYGKTVSKSNLQPGDLVFFSTNGTGRVSHVGIYIGGGKMIHSPKPGKSVSVVSINSSYYASAFVTAKRVL
ncbi:NlpC/P60 family protein [Romboutsia sp.]|uniref:C40 family peptidase n=1 Tax=Romboutsia sp. TaxID=1965302 RepID=UPI002C23C60F|nr:NlpC/P60 family protein [Romboutsia sp.]HSQ87346.1 NlpC/P60 family protein [Romboutsia sp.]